MQAGFLFAADTRVQWGLFIDRQPKIRVMGFETVKVRFPVGLALIGLMHWGASFASPCSNIGIQADKSQGVEVRVNLCPEQDRLSLGSVLAIAPGARLWLEASQAAEDGRIEQMICQSRLSSPIKARLVEDQLPWIKPDFMGNCTPWDGRQFSCRDAQGETGAFFCVAARIKVPLWNARPKLGTSLVLRSPLGGGNDFPEQAVIAALKEQVQLCRQLFGVKQTIEARWQVDSEGRVNDLAISPPRPLIPADFHGCVAAAIQYFAYPKPGQSVPLFAAF